MKIPVTRLDDCPYLLLSQINETLTNFADHCQRCSHEAIKRSLRDEQITPRVLWDHVRTQVMSRARGYVVFDDGDGTTPREPVREMWTPRVSHKPRPLQAVLLATWAAPTAWRRWSEALAKRSAGPLQSPRQGDDSQGSPPSRRVDALAGDAPALLHGQPIKSTGVPKDQKGHLCRGAVSPHRTDGVVTNDWAQETTAATHEAYGVRWTIAPRHRAGHQGTGRARCPCRKARMPRKQMGCACFVGVRLKALATQRGAGRGAAPLRRGASAAR